MVFIHRQVRGREGRTDPSAAVRASWTIPPHPQPGAGAPMARQAVCPRSLKLGQEAPGRWKKGHVLWEKHQDAQKSEPVQTPSSPVKADGPA